MKSYFIENVMNAIELHSNLEFLNSTESFGFKQARAIDRVKSLLNMKKEILELKESLKEVKSIYGFDKNLSDVNQAERIISDKIADLITFDAIWHSNAEVNPVMITGGILRDYFGLTEINSLFSTNFNRLWNDIDSHNSGLYPSDWAYHYVIYSSN